MGRPIWRIIPADKDAGYVHTFATGPHRVLSLQKWLPAGPIVDPVTDKVIGNREKHMVQLWCDPPGLMTLSVGSIRIKDPGRVAAGRKAAEARAQQEEA